MKPDSFNCYSTFRTRTMLKQWHNFDQKRQISDEREKEREGERESECVCVCGCERERQTERERDNEKIFLGSSLNCVDTEN